MTDIKGVVWQGRNEEMDDNKARYAQPTSARTLAEIIAGADMFLGLSAGRRAEARDGCAAMAAKPLILALANPEPEILPEQCAKAARPDAIIATGRSDYPNQVNNVLCFPFIFRGALDVGATTINEAMKLAAVRAIADLATRRAIGHRGHRLQPAREPALRPRLPDPAAVRSAPDREDRARRGQGRDG